MKTQNLIFLILLLFGSLANSQGTLTLLPASVNSTIRSIHFSDEMNGWMSSWEGEVFRSSDGGMSWTDVSTNYYLPFCEIHSWDNMNALISSGTGFLIRTYDGGSTWDSIPIPGSYQLLDMKFKSDSVGYLADFNECYKTTDGGLTWSLLLSNGARSFYFDINRECIGGSSGDIYVSTNNGATFITDDTGMPNTVNGTSFIGLNVGVAVDGNGWIARTTDGGFNWSCTQQPFGYDFNGVELLYGGLGYAIYGNQGGTLYETNDHGISWAEVGSYSCSGMMDMSFPTKCIGYISTLNGQVLKYEDVACNPLAGTEDFETQEFSFYPNPTTDIINFSRVVDEVSVLTANGSLIKQFNNTATINIEDLSGGIYILSINENHYTVVKN